MKAARMLVWVMSGMLLALIVLLVVGLSLGWHKEDDVSGEVQQDRVTEAFSLELQQPAGTVIESISEIDGLAAVSLSGGGLAPRILFLDISNGAIVGDLSLSAAD